MGITLKAKEGNAFRFIDGIEQIEGNSRVSIVVLSDMLPLMAAYRIAKDCEAFGVDYDSDKSLVRIEGIPAERIAYIEL